MAGLQTAAQFIAPVTQGLGTLGSIASSVSSYKNKQAQRAAQLKALQARQLINAQNTAIKKEKINFAAQAADEKRRAALKRSVARQRARFGASGISGGSGGSAQAVLLGLFDESDSERQKRKDLDRLRTQAIDQNLEQRQRLNVLQRTQLQERDNLSRISGLGNLFEDIF